MNDDHFDDPFMPPAPQSSVTKEPESVTVPTTSRKVGMNQALLLNLAIIALIAVVILTTGNALALLGIVFLKEMPYGLLMGGEEEEQGRPIGFIHPEE